jgi:hypothetical protein
MYALYIGTVAEQSSSLCDIGIASFDINWFVRSPTVLMVLVIQVDGRFMPHRDIGDGNIIQFK